jgi:ribosomal protein S18 acetylase RimI-like enzyme
MKKVTKIILKKGIKLAARQAGKSAKEFAVNTAKEAALVYIHAATDQDLAGRPFRKIKRRDRDAVLGMMKDFYSSAAVLSNGSEEIFNKDIDACISENPYLEGFVFVQKCSADAPETDDSGDDVKDEAAPETEAVKEKLLGYAMIAHSFSTEYGMPCIWIEDLYIKAPYRGKGLGSRMLQHITESFPGAVFRLEVEEENESAIAVYKKCGFENLPYMEMKK